MASANPKLPPRPKIPPNQRHRCTKSWEEATRAYRAGTEFGVFYEVTDLEEIGSGHSGEVFQCTYKPTSEKRAVKRSVTSDTTKRLVSNELGIIQRIGEHPNFLKYFSVYETTGALYVVMELGARNLRQALNKDYLNKNEHIRPAIMNELIREFLDALCHLHHRGIAHRDLKISNIICKSATSLIPIALIDFDLSFMAEDGRDVVMDTPCGNLMTYAPETIRRRMDKLVEGNPALFDALPYGEYGCPAQDNFTTDTKVDVYGFGCCVFLLCTTFSPFGRLGREDCCPRHANVPLKTCFVCLERVLRSQKHQKIFTYPQIYESIGRYGENMMTLITNSLTFNARCRPKAIELYQSSAWMQNATQSAMVEQELALTNSVQTFRSRTVDVVCFGASANPQV